jgi:hypothetical protein
MLPEMDLKPLWEKEGWQDPGLVLLDELTQRFSAAVPKSRLRPTNLPRMCDIRRSPMYLAPRGEFAKEHLHAFVPELNCPLEHVKHRSDGCLEFSKEVTELYEARVILEAVQPGESEKEKASKCSLLYKKNDFTKKDGLKRAQNISNLHKSIQESWMFAGGFSPAPTLDSIIVKGETSLLSRPQIRIQYSESIVTVEDLDWDNKREKLVCRQNISQKMIAGACLWIDNEHPILLDFERLSEQPGQEPALHENGNNDILRNHLNKRRWVWIMRRCKGKTVIDIQRTEEFYDARLAFFEHGIDWMLRSFCQRRQWTQRQTDKLATTRSIRGKLEQLMLMSQIVGKKLKANPTAAATFGPWLDFLVSSTCNENDLIFRAVRELEVARYFILGLRAMEKTNKDGGDNNGLLGVPEFSDLNDTSHLRCMVETMAAGTSKKKEKIFGFLTFLRRTRPGLTEWQQIRRMLQNVEGFCPQYEAECALLLVARRQEKHVLEEEEERERKRTSEEVKKVVQFYTNTWGEGYPPRCQCSMPKCEYRKGYLERRYTKRYEDKEPYFSKINDTGDLEESEPSSSAERISLESKRSQESETRNSIPRRSFRRKLATLLSSFRPSKPGKSLSHAGIHYIPAILRGFA